MKPFFRKLHRWLGLLMALQIVAWMASGLYFSIFPIEVIRGEHLVKAPAAVNASALPELITPGTAWANAVQALPAPHEFNGLDLVNRDGETWYRITGSAGGKPFKRLVNGTSGRVASRMNAQRARQVAESMLVTPGTHVATELIEHAEPDSEIRGRELPVWQVRFSEPESVSLYLDPWTGDLLTRRTTRWRIFDFMWMLHIMDFEARDDFNSLLLQAAAALGLIVALSGVIFWAMTTRLWRRQRASVVRS